MDAPPLGIERGKAAFVVIPDGNGPNVTVGVADVFVVALTITVNVLEG